jgi:hypothetical protein
LAIYGLVRPLLQDVKSHGGLRNMLTDFQAPTFRLPQLFTIFVIAVLAALLITAHDWGFSAKIVPFVVGSIALAMAVLSLFNDLCRKTTASGPDGMAEQAQNQVGQKMHMDLTSDTAHLPVRTIILRAARFFTYLLVFMGVMALIGLVPTVAVFVVFFMRYEGKERWSLIIPYAIVLIAGIVIAFDWFMAIPWPPTLIGTLWPALKAIPSI